MFKRLVKKILSGDATEGSSRSSATDTSSIPPTVVTATGVAVSGTTGTEDTCVDLTLQSSKTKPSDEVSASKAGRLAKGGSNFNSTPKIGKTMEQEAVTEEISSENTTETGTPSASGNPCEHFYYEVGNDLLAKPNALSDILEVFGNISTVVFCNSPSEADMVEVMLKKRDIPSEKLIGHVPYQKVNSSVQAVLGGTSAVLIITDVAARDLEVDKFGLVVNYSIHEDPEIYIHRTTGADKGSTLQGVASLVSPHDFSNFHYLRKIAGITINKRELPAQEDLVASRMESFLEEASTKGGELLEKVAPFLEAIKGSENADSILAFLINNTVSIIPELKQKAARANSQQQRSDRRDRDGDREDRGRGRDRNGRRNSRDGRDRDGRDRDRDSDRDDNGRGRRRDRREDSRDSRGERRERSERRDSTPTKKDVRIYLGHGKADSFSKETLASIIDEKTELESSVIERFSQRSKYSFVDIDEQICDSLLESLKEATLEDGSSLIAHRATTIPVPREKKEASTEEHTNGSAEESDNNQSDDGEAGYDESPKVAFDEEE